LCIHKRYDSCIQWRIALFFVATDESGGATGKANLQTRKVPLYFMTHPVLEREKEAVGVLLQLQLYGGKFQKMKEAKINTEE